MDRQILFTTGESVLGTVLVARSERGVCAILLGDDAKALERDLRARFPRDEVCNAYVGLVSPVEKVARFLPGTTRTYSEIARRPGVAATAKEVGEACAANALAVAVPCHRVLRKDGSLGGYRWGLRRKRALLARERAAA